MFDITLYGHLTFDRIFNGFQKDTSVGSMGNVWFYLNNINPNLKINLEPTEIGEALILINEEKAERTSVANLNMKSRTPTIINSYWNHILYINELSDLSFIPNIKNSVISADICRGKVLKNLDILKFIDFLFISDEDVYMSINELSSLVKQGVILHHKGGSIYYGKNGSNFSTNVKILNNINVLGCGDMFASYFINEMLCKNNVKDSIKTAHKLVTKTLKEQNG